MINSKHFERRKNVRHPVPLKRGDKIYLVSPASPPTRQSVEHGKKIFESWGLQVELGRHVFSAHPTLGYLAGTDEQRLDDFNNALRDSKIRAIIATRGGKGAYRIADGLDFEAARADPKFVVGFSEITILHLALWQHCNLVGIHGALAAPDAAYDASPTNDALQSALMGHEPIVLHSDTTEPTSLLTTTGKGSGVLIGGNLDMVATAAGWMLPSLEGAILLLEAVNMGLGQVDRQLTMLAKSGRLKALRAVAVGQFAEFATGNKVLDVLRDHLCRLEVPILGGLPLGHGATPRTAIIGAMATLDADAGTLTMQFGAA